MNCDNFLSNMNRQLDRRMPLGSDIESQQHLRSCSHCREQLNAWHQIESVLGDSPSHTSEPVAPFAATRTHFSGRMVAAGLAAMLLLAMSVRVANDHELPATFEGGSAAEVLASTSPTVASVIWRELRYVPWDLDNTILIVDRVREGVAPLQRSLLRAAMILTVGDGDRTS